MIDGVERGSEIQEQNADTCPWSAASRKSLSTLLTAVCGNVGTLTGISAWHYCWRGGTITDHFLDRGLNKNDKLETGQYFSIDF